MGPLLLTGGRILATVAIPIASVVGFKFGRSTSLPSLKPVPSSNPEKISMYQLGVLAVMAGAVMLAYKLAKEVLE